MVNLVVVNINDQYIMNYSINFFIGDKKEVTKNFLKSRNVPDIVSIPISPE